jgi:DNA-binding MarR family transcriptional regulator
VLGALLMLGPPHRLTPTFLGRYVLQTSGGMTKTLRRLQDDGLVERVPDEHDRRVSYVQLTEKGRALTTRTLSALVQEWDDALRAADVDVDEAMAMVTTLLAILERLTGSHLGRNLGV